MKGANLKEAAVVVALDGENVWVQTQREGTCNACSASKGCGQGMLNRLLPGRTHYIRALRSVGDDAKAAELNIAVGDRVEVSVPENMVLKSSIMLYLMPLLLLLLGALAGERFSGGDPGAIIGGLAGLFGGFCLVRLHAFVQRDNRSLQPQVQCLVEPMTAQPLVLSGNELRVEP